MENLSFEKLMDLLKRKDVNDLLFKYPIASTPPCLFIKLLMQKETGNLFVSALKSCDISSITFTEEFLYEPIECLRELGMKLYTPAYVLVSRKGGPEVLEAILQANNKVQVPKEELVQTVMNTSVNTGKSSLLFILSLQEANLSTWSLILKRYKGPDLTEDDLGSIVNELSPLMNLASTENGCTILLHIINKFSNLCFSDKTLTFQNKDPNDGSAFYTSVETELKKNKTGRSILALNNERRKVLKKDRAKLKKEEYVNKLLDDPTPGNIEKLLQHRNAETYLFDVPTRLGHCLFVSLLTIHTGRINFIKKLDEHKYYSSRLTADLLYTTLDNCEFPNCTPLFWLALEDHIGETNTINTILKNDESLRINNDDLHKQYVNTDKNFTYSMLFVLSFNEKGAEALSEFFLRQPELKITKEDLCTPFSNTSTVSNVLSNLSRSKKGRQFLLSIITNDETLVLSDSDLNFAITQKSPMSLDYSVKQRLQQSTTGRQILLKNKINKDRYVGTNRFFSSTSTVDEGIGSVDSSLADLPMKN